MIGLQINRLGFYFSEKSNDNGAARQEEVKTKSAVAYANRQKAVKTVQFGE
jgi:hypothetical protein